jgi:hypothetical protein
VFIQDLAGHVSGAGMSSHVCFRLGLGLTTYLLFILQNCLEAFVVVVHCRSSPGKGVMLLMHRKMKVLNVVNDPLLVS